MPKPVPAPISTSATATSVSVSAPVLGRPPDGVTGTVVVEPGVVTDVCGVIGVEVVVDSVGGGVVVVDVDVVGVSLNDTLATADACVVIVVVVTNRWNFLPECGSSPANIRPE